MNVDNNIIAQNWLFVNSPWLSLALFSYKKTPHTSVGESLFAINYGPIGP